MAEKKQNLTPNEKLYEKIQALKNDFEQIKTTLIGIDGTNGLRKRLITMESQILKLQEKHNENNLRLQSLDQRQTTCKQAFSTKEENRMLEQTLLNKLNTMEETRRKEYLEDKRAKKSLYIAVITILMSSLLNILNVIL